MKKNKSIVDYLLNLSEDNELEFELREQIKQFALNGILIKYDYSKLKLTKYFINNDKNYLLNFLDAIVFDKTKKYNENNYNSLIFHLKQKINIEMRNEYWQAYINVFMSFKIQIWNFLIENKIAPKLEKDFF